MATNPQMPASRTMPTPSPTPAPPANTGGGFWRQLGQRFNPGFRNDGRNGQRVTRGILGALLGGPMGFIRGAQGVDPGQLQLPGGVPAGPNVGMPGLDLGAINPQVGNPGVGSMPNPGGNNFGFNYGAPPGSALGMLGQYTTGNPNPTETDMRQGWADLVSQTQLPGQLPPVNAQGPGGAQDNRLGQSAGSNTWLEGQAARNYVDAGRWGTAANALAAHARLNPGHIKS